MTQITLNDEQTRLLSSASFPVVILDARGRKVVELAAKEPPVVENDSVSDEEWIAEGLRRKAQYEREGGPVYTTQEVLDHLRSLKPE
jgi:hypothetical protein